MLDERTLPFTVHQSAEPKLSIRKIRFEVVKGPDQGLVVEVAGAEARVGSGKTCDLVLKDPTVSRLHLSVRVEGDSIRVTDAGSRNGTLLDNIRVADAWARPDSTLTIGATTLRLRMSADIVELPLSRRDRLGGLLGQSIPMRRIFALLERIAPTDTTVLVEGETGTGKELVAEALHDESPRVRNPFIVFDCSAASATLIESELFGHVRGSFTGATGDRPGAFEAANGGTLFLDEIGELPLDLQPKLLRALENREVRRVGSNNPHKVDVRIVAATNRSLVHEVDRGRFREDLYYRLAVVPIRLPPLRERLGDIPVLVRHFEEKLHRAGQAPLPDNLIDDFCARSWPGNVRELRNAVARAISIGTLAAAEQAGAPASTPAPTSVPTGEEAMVVNLAESLFVGRERVAEAFERKYLSAALKQTGGNVSRAAEIAGVNRKFIQRAMKRFGSF